jgi:hypothetical protein
VCVPQNPVQRPDLGKTISSRQTRSTGKKVTKFKAEVRSTPSQEVEGVCGL